MLNYYKGIWVFLRGNEEFFWPVLRLFKNRESGMQVNDLSR